MEINKGSSGLPTVQAWLTCYARSMSLLLYYIIILSSVDVEVGSVRDTVAKVPDCAIAGPAGRR